MAAPEKKVSDRIGPDTSTADRILGFSAELLVGGFDEELTASLAHVALEHELRTSPLVVRHA